MRLKDASIRVNDGQHSMRRTAEYLSNALEDEKRARAGSKKAIRAAHLKEKHTRVLLKHKDTETRAQHLFLSVRAALRSAHAAVAHLTLFDPVVADLDSGDKGTPSSARGTRSPAHDDDDGVPPSVKKPRGGSPSLSSSTLHATTPTSTRPCVLPLERTDVMTCILAYLACDEALNGLGMASRATRAASRRPLHVPAALPLTAAPHRATLVHNKRRSRLVAPQLHRVACRSRTRAVPAAGHTQPFPPLSVHTRGRHSRHLTAVCGRLATPASPAHEGECWHGAARHRERAAVGVCLPRGRGLPRLEGL